MFIELHMIHALPPSNANRGKTGAPKFIRYGDGYRARLSSQSQKRAARLYYQQWEHFDRKTMAQRSRRHDQALAQRLEFGTDEHNLMVARFLLGLFNLKSEGLIPAMVPSVAVVQNDDKATDDEDGDKADKPKEEQANLLFLASSELDTIAEIAKNYRTVLESALDLARQYQLAMDAEPNAKKRKKVAVPQVPARDLTGLKRELTVLGRQVPGSVALFGRMMASLTEASVDGCVQVGDAISVNSYDLLGPIKGLGRYIGEIDYFTAEDDIEPIDEARAGAAHLGELPIVSPVYYRYANVNTTHLAELVGDPAIARQFAKGFLEAFIMGSLPQGYVRSHAHNTLPEYVAIQVTARQPYQHAPAFLTPINAGIGEASIAQLAVQAMRQRQERQAEVYGEKNLYQAEVSLDGDWLGMPIEPALEGALDVAMGAGRVLTYA